MLDDIEDVARREAGRLVDALEPGRAERSLADRGIDHVGQADVAGVLGRSVDLGGQVEARQFLAVERVGAARAIEGLTRRGEMRRGCGELDAAPDRKSTTLNSRHT